MTACTCPCHLGNTPLASLKRHTRTSLLVAYVLHANGQTCAPRHPLRDTCNACMVRGRAQEEAPALSVPPMLSGSPRSMDANRPHSNRRARTMVPKGAAILCIRLAKLHGIRGGHVFDTFMSWLGPKWQEEKRPAWHAPNN